MQGKNEEAYGLFFKSTWNGAWQDSGFFQAAQVDAMRGNKEKALELIDRSLWRNLLNQKGRHLKVMLLRDAGQVDAAMKLIAESQEMDHFNMGLIFEKYLLTGEEKYIDELKELMRGNVHNYIEYSLDYCMAGYYKEAIDFIRLYIADKSEMYPMATYFEGYYLFLDGSLEEAKSAWLRAAALSPDYCFPNKLEELLALLKAVEVNPGDAKAWYYLGNFWYGSRQYTDAIECWEKSVDLDKQFPTVHRNLALAYYNKKEDSQAARKSLDEAFRLDPSDARVLMELDQLYKKLGVPVDQRLTLLESHPEAVNTRDDLYLEKASLYNLKGEEGKALEMIMSRRFHPWEGGEGRVTGQYLFSHVELAKKAVRKGNYQDAINHLEACFSYPHNLGEGKLSGAQENDVYYWLGCAYEGMGETDKARKAWQRASEGISVPSAAMYYNDQQPDKIFYQGLALLKLSRTGEANSRFSTLLKYGGEQLSIPFKMDYFAVSLPDLLIFEEDLQVRHEQHCHYLMALGYLGLGQSVKAKNEFESVINTDPYHVGARVHLEMV